MAFAGAVVGCPAAPGPDASQGFGEAEVAQATLAFATSLHAKLSAGEGNLFFSPWSIETALATVDLGAGGETAEQMGRVLHLGVSAAPAANGFADLRRRLVGAGDALQTADSIWIERAYPLRADFLRRCEAGFGAEAKATDFIGNPEAARAGINAWASAKTHRRIPTLIGPGGVTANTRLVVCSAIYFKSDWDHPFDSSFTEPQTFTTGSGAETRVPMMRQGEECQWAQVKGAAVLELAYRTPGLAMLIVLPDAVHGLPAIEKSLSPAQIEGWTDAVEASPPRVVAVTIPRFRLEWSAELTPALLALGMTDAFDPARADFSGMSAGRGVFISAVVHKAFIEVDESGTEAAAATATEMNSGSAYAPAIELPTFIADHPFLFLIYQVNTREVLFIGRVVDPR